MKAAQKKKTRNGWPAQMANGCGEGIARVRENGVAGYSASACAGEMCLLF